MIFGRLAESDGVIFQAVPAYQENVTAWLLDTSLKIMAAIAVHLRDDSGCRFKCGFKV